MSTIMGKFIAFEGIDGSGKSTQIQLLSDRLRKMERSFYVTMEPTDAPVGSLIRQILTGRIKTDLKVIAPLFAADRLDHLLNEVNGICAKISQGTVVLIDRYYFSSYAYQGIDAPMDWVIKLNEQSSSILRPDLNIFINTDPDTALERIVRNRFQKELFEEKTRLARVRQAYMEAFDLLRDQEHVAIVDGNRSADEVAQDIWNIVKNILAA